MALLKRSASSLSTDCRRNAGPRIGLWLLGACVTPLLLLTPATAEQVPERPTEGRAILVAGPQAADPIGQLRANAISLETVDVGPPVKGAPYSAEATTETIQILSDGNRIVRRTSALIYRDSRGRTRREATLDAIAGLVVTGGSLRTITVSDPEAGTTYHIDPDKRVRVVRHRPSDVHAPIAQVLPVGPRGGSQANAGAKTDEISLGTRVMEGLTVEGTRTTVTLPAGAIGNERPIESVTERWFAPELRIVVLSRRKDPRFGETTYRLTKITRAEPPASLFDVRP